MWIFLYLLYRFCFMLYRFFFFLSLIHFFSFSQVVAEGDAVLCEDEAGTPVLLTATSFAVDLTDANIYTDDIYGGVINMGFDFDFYGNTYNQVVLSSNNYLTFNTAVAGGGSGWAIGGAVPNNWDAPMNAILCPWQDIYPGVNGNGTIQYATIGEAPNRVFIASFCGIPMFSCTDICYSSQIKLYETTNIVETHIAQKVLCSTWNGGAAIHALHNIDGTIAHVVTGLDGVERNYPNEWTCENDGWRFIPNGTNDYIIENIEFAPAVAGTDIIWQDQFGNQIGTGGEITVFPTEDITYTAGASLCGDAGDWCGFEGGIEGDDVLITFESVDILSVDIINAPCDNPNGGSAVVFIDGTPPYTYSWENSAGDIISTFSASLGNLSSDTYQFTITSANGCEDTVEIFIDTDGDAVTQANAGNDIETCDDVVALSANAPLSGESGFWTVIQGGASVSLFSDPNATVSNLSFGDNIFVWTLENECGPSSDEVTINLINGIPTISNPGVLNCLEDIPLSVDIENGEGQWTVVPSDGVEIVNPLSTNTTAIVSDYGSYIFTFEGCNGIDSETITMSSVPPILSGPVEVFCLEEFQLSASVEGDAGYWDFIGPGNIQFTNSQNVNTLAVADAYGTYEIIYYGCGGTSTMMIEMVNPTPNIEDPGVIYCNLETEVVASASLGGQWSEGDNDNSMIINGNGNSAFVSVSEYGDYNIVFTSCGVSDTLALSFQVVQPYIITSDHQNCIFSLQLNAMTPDPNPGPWEQISGPSIANIANPYSTSTQAVVSEYGLYTFSFTSCESTNTIEVGVACPLTVPNSFSPNGDGVNDVFIIPDLTPNVYTQSVLYIYNKWGRVMFIDPNYGLDGEWWDGQTTYNEKPLSSFLPVKAFDENNNGYVNDGVYFYTLEVYNLAHGQKEFYSGDVSVFTKEK